ncbi:MAG TPA: hypothetical protein ENH87_15020 [Pricia antarctica]|uniref:GDSL-like Lipase/Acylhydrolase family protein n=1 Tax=Pricia antarctica TaxID=641691 RepID=A0A831QSV9_9FLAO|nr:hypothetical protein [Pricia antarctica]
MEKFIRYSFKFAATVIVSIAILVVATGLYARYAVNFKISQEINILVLGNSHPECAIDDSLLPNIFNLAQSGSGYFYDYVKAKHLLKNNSQVDTLILGYAYGDIGKDMDLWFSGEERIKFKIRNHFFLFDLEDYLAMLKANPIATILNTPQTIFHNLKMSKFGISGLGGYKRLTRNKLEVAKDRNEMGSLPESAGLSQYQTKYLRKIYQLCDENMVQLVLLATPMHPMKVKHQELQLAQYCGFAKEQMPNAILIDHTRFKVPEKDYADLAHLNYKGALRYSEYLKKIRFNHPVTDCNK